MPVARRCPSCGAEFAVPDEFAERKVGCPFCAAAAPPVESEKDSPKSPEVLPDDTASTIEIESRRAQLAETLPVGVPEAGASPSQVIERAVESALVHHRLGPKIATSPRASRLITGGVLAISFVVLLLFMMSRRAQPPTPEGGWIVIDWPDEQREGAQLQLDEEQPEPVPEGELRIQRRPGELAVVATRPAFEPYRTTLTVEAGATHRIRPVWKPSPSILLVDWPPSERSGATVNLDSKPMEVSGAGQLRYECPAGRHCLVATRPDFEQFETTVSTQAGQAITITPVWKPLPETVLVFDWPDAAREKATLRVDGQPVDIGPTGPIQVPCEPGSHTVTAEREGFRPFARIISVAPHQTNKVQPEWRSFPPELLTPESGTVLDNASRDGLQAFTWEFKWSALREADRYHLMVTEPGSTQPRVNESQLTEPSHREISTRTMPAQNLSGWRWKVRARVRREWTDWSDERTFTVKPAEKHPVPTAAERQALAKKVDELYNRARVKTSKARRELAKTVAEAGRVAVDAKERFAILSCAMELAQEVGEVELAMEVIDNIDRDFRVDAVQVKAFVLVNVAKNEKADKTASFKALVDESAKVRQGALATDRYELAYEVDDAILRACQRPLGHSNRVAMKNRRDETKELTEMWQKLQEAHEVIATKDADPEANLLLGTWYGLRKGDWKRGLPHLAKGSDEKLRRVAQLELNPPADASAQAQLANNWCELGRVRRDRSKCACLSRAAYWYIRAEESADSLLISQTIEKQLQAICDSAREAPEHARESLLREIDQRFTYRLTGSMGPNARIGDIRSLGKTYKVAVIAKGDGQFGNLSEGRLIIDLNRDGQLVPRGDSAEFHKLNAPFNVHGRIWEVVSLSPDGSLLRLKPSSAHVEMRPYLEPGYPAPVFAGTGLDGKPVDLKQLATKSKYLLLDFWADWCPYCRQQYDSLKRLHSQYAARGLTIVGINADSDPQDAFRVAQREGLTYPHVYNGRSFLQNVFLLYRIRGIPNAFLLDKNLNIVACDLRGHQLEQRVSELVGRDQ